MCWFHSWDLLLSLYGLFCFKAGIKFSPVQVSGGLCGEQESPLYLLDFCPSASLWYFWQQPRAGCKELDPLVWKPTGEFL